MLATRRDQEQACRVIVALGDTLAHRSDLATTRSFHGSGQCPTCPRRKMAGARDVRSSSPL